MKQEIITMLVGAAPITEIRGAIPLAIGLFGFSPLKAYLLSLIGNLAIIVPGLLAINYVVDWLSHRFYYCNRFFSWLFAYTKVKHEEHFKKFVHFESGDGENVAKRDFWLTIALFLLVAIPLPLTGAWTGILVAFVFGIPFWRSVWAISLGTAVAGIIVLLAVMGVIQVAAFI